MNDNQAAKPALTKRSYIQLHLIIHDLLEDAEANFTKRMLRDTLDAGTTHCVYEQHEDDAIVYPINLLRLYLRSRAFRILMSHFNRRPGVTVTCKVRRMDLVDVRDCIASSEPASNAYGQLLFYFRRQALPE